MTDWLTVTGALVALAVVGAPAAGTLVPRLGLVEGAALSLWLGFAGVTLSLLLVGFVMPYSRAAAAAAAALTLAAGVGARLLLGRPHAPRGARRSARLFGARNDRILTWAALAGVAVVVLQVVLIAVENYIDAYDFFATWGLDAKIFFLRHAVNFHGLGLVRAYYPAGMPMGHLWFDLWLAKLGDRHLLLPLAFETAAFVVVTRMLLLRLGVGRPLAAVLTFFLCAGSGAFLFSALSGYGDLPIAAGLTIGVGAAAIWLKTGGRWLALSGIGSGLAVWSKFEGLPSVALVAVALLAAWFLRGRRGRDLTQLAIWLILVLLFSVPWYALVEVRHLNAGGNHSGAYFHPIWIMRHVVSQLSDPRDWGVWWAGAIALALATAPAWLRTGLWTRWLGFLVLAELAAVLGVYLVAAHASGYGHTGPALSVPVPRLYFHWTGAVVLLIGVGLQAALARGPAEADGLVTIGR